MLRLQICMAQASSLALSSDLILPGFHFPSMTGNVVSLYRDIGVQGMGVRGLSVYSVPLSDFTDVTLRE